MKFDLPGQRPQRYRLIYRHTGPDATPNEAVEIVVAGPRGEHEVYRLALARLGYE